MKSIVYVGMLTVLTVVAVTVLTRFLSFVLFPLPERTPAFVRYLGRVLPAAVFGFLVVYCLRGGTALYMLLLQFVFSG